MNIKNNVYRVGRFDQLTRTVFTVKDGLPSNQAASLCFDRAGRLFVGTDKGLAVLKSGRFEPVDLGFKHPNSTMLALSDNGLYVGVEKELLEYDGKKAAALRSFTSPLVDIKKDGDGTTWILTESVLYRLPAGADDFDMKIGVPGKGQCLAVRQNNVVSAPTTAA